MAMRPSNCVNLAIDFQMLDPLALRNVSAASSAANLHVLQSTNLRSLLPQKVEEEQALESQNLMVDVGFEEMAALKHCLKIALRVYAALQESLCLTCRRNITAEDRSNIGLGYYKYGLGYYQYGLCVGCFQALTTAPTEDDGTLVESHCVALTADGVHTAILLLNAHRAGSECRFSRADAACVRNVNADTVVNTSCLNCYMRCHETFQQDAFACAGPVRAVRASYSFQ